MIPPEKRLGMLLVLTRLEDVASKPGANAESHTSKSSENTADSVDLTDEAAFLIEAAASVIRRVFEWPDALYRLPFSMILRLAKAAENHIDGVRVVSAVVKRLGERGKLTSREWKIASQFIHNGKAARASRTAGVVSKEKKPTEEGAGKLEGEQSNASKSASASEEAAAPATVLGTLQASGRPKTSPASGSRGEAPFPAQGKGTDTARALVPPAAVGFQDMPFEELSMQSVSMPSVHELKTKPEDVDTTLLLTALNVAERAGDLAAEELFTHIDLLKCSLPALEQASTCYALSSE